jgi:deazaflavin-dependent oxidoreductase (nitroreductase family)
VNCAVTDFNQQIIEEFRANGGKVGGNFESTPLLLIHHRGAKTGIERVNPLAYRDLGGGSLAIFASKGGAPTNPDWFYNLRANPNVTIELGAETVDVVARVASDEERDRIWEAQKQAFPNFAKYEQLAGSRKIPVVVLDRA